MHGKVEFRHQIEGQITSHALEVEKLRENKAQENKKSPADLCPRQRLVGGRALRMMMCSGKISLIPSPGVVKDNDPDQCKQRKPENIASSARTDYQGRQERAHRLTGVS